MCYNTFAQQVDLLVGRYDDSGTHGEHEVFSQEEIQFMDRIRSLAEGPKYSLKSIDYDGIEVKRWFPEDGIKPFLEENNSPECINVGGTPMIFIVPVEHTLCAYDRTVFMTFPPPGYPAVRHPITVLLWPEATPGREIHELIGYRCNSWLRWYDRNKEVMAHFRYQQSLLMHNGIAIPSLTDMISPPEEGESQSPAGDLS